MLLFFNAFLFVITGIRAMLDHPRITVHTSVDFFGLRDGKAFGIDESLVRQLLDGMSEGRTKVVYTGPIDYYFKNAGFPKLEYRSIKFKTEHLKMAGYYQPNSVVNFPSADVSITRTVEYKHFLGQKSEYTTIVSETTTDHGDPYYPVPNPRNQETYKLYQNLACEEKNVYFLGRLASYKYFNMDQAIQNALEFWDGSHLATKDGTI
jgi:UDP-galactopyranose mutase